MQVKDLSFSTKILNGASLLTLFVGFIFLLFLGYSLFYPRTNLELGGININNIDHSVDTHIQHSHLIAGEELEFRINVCKLTNIPVTLSGELFDGNKDIIPLFTKIIASDLGCGNVAIVTELPNLTQEGEYNLRIVATQRINYLRSTRDEKVIGGFDVVPQEHE